MKKEIDMVVFDIDGVLTNGTVSINEDGEEFKSYRLTEIDSLNEIKKDGFLVGAITGEDTPIVDIFEKVISWDVFIRGCKDKANELRRIIKSFGIEREQLCYIGDGKYDVPAIQYAGLGVCPGNAIREAKDAADIVLEGKGGESCIYELYRLLKGYAKEPE